MREALIELAREGIVETVPRRGFRLRSIAEPEAREWFELRNLIESYVVQRLAAEGSPKDVATLRGIIERQAAATDDPIAFVEVDEEFHLTMPALLGLERTRQFLAKLRGIIWLAGSSAITDPDRIAEVLDEHRRVVDAIAAHDGDAAAAARPAPHGAHRRHPQASPGDNGMTTAAPSRPGRRGSWDEWAGRASARVSMRHSAASWVRRSLRAAHATARAARGWRPGRR